MWHWQWHGSVVVVGVLFINGTKKLLLLVVFMFLMISVAFDKTKVIK